MKKLLTILLALMLMFAFAACGSHNGTTDNPDPSPAGEPPVAEPPAPDPEPEPETYPEPVTPAPAGDMFDPLRVYFHDTYNQISSDPSIMWGDLRWEGWFNVMQPLTDEGGGWYSFEMPSESITSNYNMLIFFNGLQDSDPDSIQWVWNSNRIYPKGNYFIADKAAEINPPDVNFAGEQRDATSFETFEEAEAAIKDIN
jgi:hypothetical protein